MASSPNESPVVSSPLKKNDKRKRCLLSNQDVPEIWKNIELSFSKLAVKCDDFLPLEEPIKTTDDILGEELHCRTCLLSFSGLEDYRFHYKEDLHRYNLKLKINGKPAISQEQFCEIEDGISSISGSDSEDDKSTVSKFSVGSPKVYFQNDLGQKMAVYRCLLYPNKKVSPSNEDLIGLISELPSKNLWAIIMLGGGHFAAAIYQGNDMLHHKTFHSYTVRAKQGGSQSNKDNKSGGGSHCKSAGASLRRYNEAAFAEHVQSLFSSWSEVLKKCDLIFYRAASSNQTIMFGGKNPNFDRGDERLRSIPFPTRRATLKEIQRVWLELATVEMMEDKDCSEVEEDAVSSSLVDQHDPELDREISDEELKVLELQRAKRMKKKLTAKMNSNNAIEPVEFEEDVREDLFPGEKDIMDKILKSIQQGNASLFEGEIDKLSEIVHSYTEEYHLDLSEILNQRIGENCETLLHKAAAIHKRSNFVWKLMELGCDPSLVDALGRVPYMLATDKETRAVFRRFMGSYPDKFDYSKAAIPSPLTDEIEKQKAERLAEKRKQQKQAKKEKKVIEKARLEDEKRKQEELNRADEEKRKIEEEKKRFLSLSDREKRALAAERRLLANATSSGLTTPVLVCCFFCGVDISGKVPFEYNSNKFCSPPCLQKHRKQNSK